MRYITTIQSSVQKATAKITSNKRSKYVLPVLFAVTFGIVGLKLLTQSNAATTQWVWEMSGIHGGGTAQVIAADPKNARYATVGGDSWGVYNTVSAGNDWSPATKGIGIVNKTDPDSGDFFFMGLAYSQKYPDRVYALNGKLGNNTSGGFGYVKGNAYTVVTRSVNGAEDSLDCGDRTQRPRCTGNRVIVDFDVASSKEYIYIAQGSGKGVSRSTDDGKTWTTIGLQGVADLTGMALDPVDKNSIYVATRTTGSYKISSVRGASVVTKLTASPVRVEEMSSIGNSVYAAAATSGIYKLSSGGTVWTKLGGTTLTNGTIWSAAGGNDNVIYVGGFNTQPGKTIAKSEDGGITWKWLPGDKANISNTPWGTNSPWWLGQAVSRVMFGCFDGCTYESTSITVDKFNPNIVYSAGRSGVWKSENAGATWAPAVQHLGGTMHTNLAVASDGSISVDDVDWVNINTSDHFETVTKTDVAKDYGPAGLSTSHNGKAYNIALSVPRDITEDGISIADEYFRAAAVRPRDIAVSADGNYIYIALFGGGVLVGHKVTVTPPPPPPPPAPTTDTPPSVSVTKPIPTSTVSGDSVTLTANAIDDIKVAQVTFRYRTTGQTGWSPISTDTSAPYAATWDTSSIPNGSYDLIAVAEDSIGQRTQSDIVAINVVNIVKDTTSPSITILSPIDRAQYSRSKGVNITASASDNVGIDHVDMFVGSQLLKRFPKQDSYSYNWDTSNKKNGKYTITVRAYDASGNVASSNVVINLRN